MKLLEKIWIYFSLIWKSAKLKSHFGFSFLCSLSNNAFGKGTNPRLCNLSYCQQSLYAVIFGSWSKRAWVSKHLYKLLFHNYHFHKCKKFRIIVRLIESLSTSVSHYHKLLILTPYYNCIKIWHLKSNLCPAKYLVWLK